MTVEWQNWCRLCAGSQDVNVSLCDEGKHVSVDVIGKASKYLNLDISRNCEDSNCFPKSVCNNCVEYLHQIDSFAVQCAHVQDMFYNLSQETGGDNKIYLIKHRFLNNIKDNLKGVEKNNEKNECQRVTCSFEVKSYETVPSIEHDDTKDESHSGIDKVTGTVSIPRRGRPRKQDRIVPRIKLRAIRPPTHEVVEQSFEITDDTDKGIIDEDSPISDFNQKRLIGAARRKAKPPKNVHPNNSSNECDEDQKTVEPKEKESPENVADGKNQKSNDASLKRLKRSELKAIIPSLFNFKCHICEVVFKNWNALRNHCKDTHGKAAQMTCDCGKILSTRPTILEHLARHTRTNLFSCDQCKKTFHRKSLLNNHRVSHLPKEEQPYVCCKCARRFHCEALLRNHERTHLPKEERLMFPCDICNKMFTSKSSVSAHQKAVHQGERPFVCEQCGHSFTSKGILQEHLTVHSDDAPWNCSKCSKNFKTKYRLKIHMDTHRETPYQCPKCPVQLSTRRTLRMHLVVHKDTKAYQCSICGKAFRRAKDLKNHTNLHTGRRPYTCPFCSRTFANGSNCRSHKLRMHREELKAYESSNQSADSNQGGLATTESNENSDVTAANNKEGITTNVVFINAPLASEQEPGKIEYKILNTSNPDTSFPSFVSTSDQRHSPQMKQPANLIRNTFSQHFALDHQYYSPSHEQDISSAAVPAFPGIPYIHHQPLVFNRTLDQS